MQLHYQFDFDGSLAWQLRGPDGYSCMAACFSEHGNEQIGCTVENLRLIGEAGSRGDIADHLDDLLDSVQRSGFAPDDTEAVQHRYSRCLNPLFDCEVLSELAGHNKAAIA